MIVRVPDLSDEVRTLDFHEQAAKLNDALGANDRWVDQRFEEDVTVRADLYRSGTDVHFNGSVTGSVTCTCPRCLDEFRRPLAREFRFLIVKAEAGQDVEDDEGLDHYDGDELDLGPLVREQAILALDSAELCSEDCLGLCVRCGANRNREPCTCTS
jgi:uncharacterized protein